MPPRHSDKINARRGKAKTKPPESADEFLAAGVELEEAGEKWRAGDPAKSARFFLRAIESYDAALQSFSTSFDLAYNKARVQYQITQHPTLAAQIPIPLLDLLRVALESHKYALNLRQDNADVLFNTAQVLTSLAEALMDGRATSDAAQAEALTLLEESLSLFQRCLSVQEFQLSEAQADQEAFEQDQHEDNGVPLPASTTEEDTSMASTQSETTDQSEEDESGQWAYVMEPVTASTLLDTALAQLSTLTTICSVLSIGLLRSTSSSAGTNRLTSLLNWVDEYSNSLFQDKITPILMSNPTEAAVHAEEIALARANFSASLADANCRAGLIDPSSYLSALTSAFSTAQIPDRDASAAILTAQVEALIAFNGTIATMMTTFPATSANHQPLQIRWTALTTALGALTTAATKIPGGLPPAEAAPVHLLRGDVELLRARLGDGSPWDHPSAVKNRPTLLRNAEVFFRGAKSLASAAAAGGGGSGGGSLAVGFETPAEVKDAWSEAMVKEALAKALAGGGTEQLRAAEKDVGAERTLAVLEEVTEEGLVGEEVMRTLVSGN